jgi:hypothetical protein
LVRVSLAEALPISTKANEKNTHKPANAVFMMFSFEGLNGSYRIKGP